MRCRIPALVLAAPLAFVLFGAVGCRSIKETGVAMFRHGDLITYEQYMQVGGDGGAKPSVDDVINMLGEPNDMHDRDGKRIRLDYLCLTMNDEIKRAEFKFNSAERLLTKDLW